MTPAYYQDEQVTLRHGDALDQVDELEDASVEAVVTSPPYWGLRDYGDERQWGAEPHVQGYIGRLVDLFRELRRVLVPSGVVWLNLGDTYAGKANASTTSGGFDRDRPGRQIAQRNRLEAAPYKSLVGVPWRVGLALIEDGWVMRNDVIWSKPNPMPSPVGDRLTSAHEHAFLLTPQANSHFDLEPLREPLRRPDLADGSISFGGRRAAARGDDGTASSRMVGRYTPSGRGRNPGDVWSLAPASGGAALQQTPGAEHFAVMPRKLARRMVLSACPEGGTVLDPFSGSGTTGIVARQHGRRYIGVDIRRDYLDLTIRRLAQGVLL